MKKLSYVLLIMCLTGFAIINIGNKTIVAEEQLDLLTLASVVEGEQIPITGWSLHAREKVDHLDSLEDVKEFSNDLQKKFPEWSWNVNSKANMWEATGISTTDHGPKEKIQVLTTLTNHQPQTYIIYEVNDVKFSQQTTQFLENELPLQLSDIFRGKPTIFSCIKGEFSDKMNKSLPDTVNRLLTQFKAEEIESLDENNFVSSSAYSPMLSETLTSNQKEMNLQVGLRTQGLGAKTTLVVGTPIITIEY
ncbi:YwmB family TATA-box binding protein [Robertmurraya beringensis]|uniref:YwmB family TATA-box binding protein n=1 Tax=Robertmurraya beringensis TaxID=641660 RepID=A0ABV6KR67_9BACI